MDELIEAMKRAGWRQVPADAAAAEANGYNPLDVVHEGGLIIHAQSGDTPEGSWKRAILACIDVASGV